MEEEGTPYPSWLRPMLKTRFFTVCDIHESCKENERNHYCLDCTTGALCPSCLIFHDNHRVTQIRRSSYHDVIRVHEIQKYLDVHDIQPYSINQAPVVFLNKREQRGTKKGYIYACKICQRGISQRLKFCSLGCKFGGIEDDIPEQRFGMSINYRRDEVHDGVKVDESFERTKLARLDGLKQQTTELSHSLDLGITETINSPSPPSLPVYNHFNSRKRKGNPRRASLF